MEPLFPALPQDLSTLTDEALAEALSTHRDIATRLHAREAELIEGRTAEDVVEQFQAGVVAIQAINAEVQARSEAEAATAATMDELAAEAGVLEVEAAAAEDDEPSDDAPAEDAPAEDAPADDAPDDPADDDDETGTKVDVAVETAETAEVEEPVVAAAEPPARRMRLPAATRRHQAQPAETTGPALVAAAGIEGVREGTVLDRAGLAKAIIEKQRRMGSMPAGYREEVVVASAHYDYPEERRLTGDSELDAERIRAVCSPDAMGVDRESGEPALIAAGGLCAPLTPIYDLPLIATSVRPVRDALAGFQATRGGINYPSALTLADVTDAIGIVTADEDAQGGTFATKTCQVLDCDPFNETEIQALFACIQWGNFGARTWPERIANFTELVGAAHARMAEGALLDALKAGSTQVTAAMATYGYGAASNLLSEILTAAAGMRSRHRTSPDLNLRVLLPAWTIDLLTSDIINGEYGRFERSREGVKALLGAYGVTPSWYLDSETGGGMIYGSQNAGALLTFPDTVKWFMFPEGTWVFLDGGTLDLGIVRDSTLNATNDYQVFWETFENAAKLGVESLEITSTVCPNGTYGPPATALAC